jgi:hypothetical protein
MELIGAYESEEERETVPTRPALPTADQAFGTAAAGATAGVKRRASGATVLQHAQSKQGARRARGSPCLRRLTCASGKQGSGPVARQAGAPSLLPPQLRGR